MTPAELAHTVEKSVDILTLVLWFVGGVLAGLVGSFLLTGVLRVIGHRRPFAAMIVHRARRPVRAILVVLGAWTGLLLGVPEPRSRWFAVTQHGLLIVLIAACTWFLAALIRVIEDAALMRIQRVGATARARRVQTQAQVLRRVGVAIIVVLGIAGVLLTFPGMRAAGASILASAGVLSVVAGLAAQTTLGNVFAGFQLAMTDAIRVDDVVIVEKQFGHIEEITLTYVVVRLWDDRRMIMPSTYFTTQPFENWTRQAPALLGTVEFEVDWRVPVPRMRLELERLLRLTDLWDGRVGILQVENATGGSLLVRALVSGKDAPTLTDLKYFLRENLVDWLQTQVPYALPFRRFEQQEVTRLFDDSRDPRYAEAAEEMEELAELDGARRPADDTLVVPAANESPQERRERQAAARRARRRAEKEDRRRSRFEGLHHREEALHHRYPSQDETQRLDPRALALEAERAAAAASERADEPASERDGAAGPEGAGASGDGARRGDTGRSGTPPVETENRPTRTSLRERASRLPITDPHGTAVLPGAGEPAAHEGSTARAGHEASIFSGSPEAEERAQAFAGPGQEALDERELTADRKRVENQRAEQLYGRDAAPDDGGDGDGGGGEGD
ncbi:mechanosensitive ion channel family protein [Georgenia ruanii]|uniref:mechanosensitive ion channel family protein n=1 Tax=Georgenia ruanii TaxID=348442 RepID=UPI001D0097AE|nr:mechanosensitive ion channel domain-containing protein [Georgenia ruanii]